MGLSAVPDQCATVLVVGNTFAPPTVMSEAWIAESGTAIGAGVVPALAVEARNGRATVSPPSTVSLRAMRRVIRSLRIADMSVALSHTAPDAALRTGRDGTRGHSENPARRTPRPRGNSPRGHADKPAWNKTLATVSDGRPSSVTAPGQDPPSVPGSRPPHTRLMPCRPVGPDGAANRPFCSPPLTTTKEIGSSTERRLTDQACAHGR